MHSRSQPENFIRGAFLITLAQLVSRVLGAVYRPVAQHFIGDEGLALVTPPNSAYFIIAAISSVGLNVAISRFISERIAVGDYRGARRIYRVATAMLIISGLFFGALFAIGAPWVAAWMGFPEAWPGFVVLAPAVVLVSLVCAFRGLYQGMQQMRPSAMSQVVEQFARVALGLALVALLAPLGLNWGAAGFNAGGTIGVMLAAAYGWRIYFKQRPTAGWTTTAEGVESLEHESTRRLLGKILSVAFPLSMIGAILPLMQFIDSSIVTNRLLAIGVEEKVAKAALAYLVNAGTLRDLPFILTAALYVSLVPAVAESVSTGRLDQARYRAETAFRITYLIGIPATVGLLIGDRDTYGVLFTGPGWLVMAPLAWSTLFFMLQQTASGALQGAGMVGATVRNLVLGTLVKIGLTYWWTGLPNLQVRGAAYATSVAFLLVAVLNLLALRRRLGLRLRLVEDAVRPLAAAALMGAVIWLVSPIVHGVIGADRLAGLVVVSAGGLVYLLAIFILGGVREADLGLIPGVTGGMITALRRVGFLRD